jgi:hypothetical protein
MAKFSRYLQVAHGPIFEIDPILSADLALAQLRPNPCSLSEPVPLPPRYSRIFQSQGEMGPQ